MGRIRTIKPEIPQSESMGNVSREARLLFILLWTLVDDEGRTRAASRMLSSLLYPYDRDQAKLPAFIDGWLTELEHENCLRRYKVGGNAYLEILNWKKHQKIDKPTKSRIPSPVPLTSLDKDREDSPNKEEDSPTDMDQDQDLGEDQGKDHSALVERAFEFYCREVGKDPAKYTLTEERRKKALRRVSERLAVNQGDLVAVRKEIAQAIRNLAASEYHMTQGYMDWVEQIFRSAEEFEKRLSWKKPEAERGTNQTKTERSLDAATAAIQAIENRAPPRKIEYEETGITLHE